jgi:hypothetical protein
VGKVIDLSADKRAVKAAYEGIQAFINQREPKEVAEILVYVKTETGEKYMQAYNLSWEAIGSIEMFASETKMLRYIQEFNEEASGELDMEFFPEDADF